MTLQAACSALPAVSVGHDVVHPHQMALAAARATVAEVQMTTSTLTSAIPYHLLLQQYNKFSSP